MTTPDPPGRDGVPVEVPPGLVAAVDDAVDSATTDDRWWLAVLGQLVEHEQASETAAAAAGRPHPCAADLIGVLHPQMWPSQPVEQDPGPDDTGRDARG